MSTKKFAKPDTAALDTDEVLRDMKRAIQEDSRLALRLGQLRQEDLFLISPELARKATIRFKSS